jgi:hypothetical protein
LTDKRSKPKIRRKLQIEPNNRKRIRLDESASDSELRIEVTSSHSETSIPALDESVRKKHLKTSQPPPPPPPPPSEPILLADWLKIAYLDKVSFMLHAKKPQQRLDNTKTYAIQTRIDLLSNSLSMTEQSPLILDSIYNLSLQVGKIAMKSNSSMSMYELFDVFENMLTNFGKTSIKKKQKDSFELIQFFNEFYQAINYSFVEPILETYDKQQSDIYCTPGNAQKDKINEANFKEAEVYWSKMCDYLKSDLVHDERVVNISELRLNLCSLQVFAEFYKLLALSVYQFKSPSTRNKYWMKFLKSFDFEQTVFDALLIKLRMFIEKNCDSLK